MSISDVHSRLANPEKNAEIPLHFTVDDLMLEVDDDNACSIDMINFSIKKRVQLREMSTADPALRALQRVVNSGWPDTIKDLRPYWSYRDEIGISDGVIFKRKQVIIPDELRSDILHQLHEVQLGIEKTRLLMRESVYWPNICKDMEMMVECSAVCQESQTQHREQPLLAHDVPSTPWTKLTSDMFQIKGHTYLLVTDYHSKVYLVEKMHSTTNCSIVNKSAHWFSMFGSPLEIVTDNGPQYVGQPYEDMCSKCNIKHTTTSPRYTQSNGLIERQVRTVTWSIQKYAKTGNDTLITLQQH